MSVNFLPSEVREPVRLFPVARPRVRRGQAVVREELVARDAGIARGEGRGLDVLRQT